MSSNKIISSATIGTVKNGGRSIMLKYATQTTQWTRVHLSKQTQDNLAKAIEKADVPPSAAIAIMAETEHPSQKDSYPHYTVDYQDDNGKHITRKHVHP